MLKTDISNEPKRALQKPLTEKPGATYPANIKSKAFNTNVNSPNVKKFIGNVMNVKIGRTNILINPITITTSKAAQKLETLIPGIIQAISIIAKE